MVPKGWTKRDLGSILEFKNGINTDAGNYGYGTKFVNVMDVLENEALTHDQIRGSVNITDDQLNTYGLKRGDILFNRTSETREEIAFASVYLDEESAVFGGFIIRGRPTNKLLDPTFSKYCFRATSIRREMTRRCQGAIRANIGQSDMSEIAILLPPIKEQKEIAKMLSAWDRAIDTANRLIQNSKLQKRALMQRLLTVRQRFCGSADIPWKLVPLRDLCTIRRGASPRPIDDPKWFADEGRGWVRISDVTASQTERLESTDQYLSSLGTAKSVAVDPGELFMSICATIGIPKIAGIPVCIHDGFVVFREVSPRLNQEFLYYLLEFKTRELASSGQPGTQKNLNTGIVGGIQVPDLPTGEQQRIVSTLKAADERIRRETALLEQLQRQKNALMQQLLTGERRVKVNYSAAPVAVNG